jgi:hypothetical protein
MMKRQHWILAILFLVAAGYWGLTLSSIPTANSLAVRALSATKPEERADAVAQLTLIKEPQTWPQLRRVAAESKDPEVVLTAINTLATSSNPDSLSLFLDTLNHEDKRAREAAYRAVLLGRDVVQLEAAGYQASDPPEKRSLAVARLREAVQEKIPAKSLRVLVAESRMKESGTDAGVKEAPTPSIAPTPEMVPLALPPPQDYPAIHLLVWLCRGLAVVVLLADVLGAVSLLRGDRAQSGSGKRKDGKQTPPTVEEQLEKILARNSAGQGAEITRLLAGAVCAVALLVVAEMILMAWRVEQRAASMDQKLDYLSRVR